MSEYWQNLKAVLAPLATVLGLAAAVLWFAADAWVRNIVNQELDNAVIEARAAHEKLIEHEGKLNQHNTDIDDNKRSLERQDERFTNFVLEIMEKL